MVQKFRTYQRVRSNKTGFLRFSAVGTKAADRYVEAGGAVSRGEALRVGETVKFQRYTSHDLTTYDLLNNGERIFSWVKPEVR